MSSEITCAIHEADDDQELQPCGRPAVAVVTIHRNPGSKWSAGYPETIGKTVREPRCHAHLARDADSFVPVESRFARSDAEQLARDEYSMVWETSKKRHGDHMKAMAHVVGVLVFGDPVADFPEVTAVIGECGEWKPQVGEWVTGESATDIKGPRVGKYVRALNHPAGITEIIDARDGQPSFVLTSTLLPRDNGGAA